MASIEKRVIAMEKELHKRTARPRNRQAEMRATMTWLFPEIRFDDGPAWEHTPWTPEELSAVASPTLRHCLESVNRDIHRSRHDRGLPPLVGAPVAAVAPSNEMRGLPKVELPQV